MKRHLLIAIIGTALAFVGAQRATAQQIASISELRAQVIQLEKLVRSTETPSAIRSYDLRLLAERRVRLRSSLQNQSEALRRYLTSYETRLSTKEKQSVAASLKALDSELRGLEEEISVGRGAGQSDAKAASHDDSAMKPLNTLNSTSNSNAPTVPKAGLGRRDDDAGDQKRVTSLAPINEGDATIKGFASRHTKRVIVEVWEEVKPKDAKGDPVAGPSQWYLVQRIWQPNVNSETGEFSVTLDKALKKNQAVRAWQDNYSTVAGYVVQPGEMVIAKTTTDDSKKGQPFGLLFGGAVMSQQANEFSQTDPFFGFAAGYDSKLRDTLSWRWHLRFQGVFTADGRAATGQSAPVAPSSASPNTFTFIASRKAFIMDTHGWIDFWANNVFTIGPYGAWGASTALSKNELANQTVTNPTGGTTTANNVVTQLQSDNDLKQFKELGLMMNINTPDKKLFLQSILARGWYEAYKGLVPGVDTGNRFVGKLRVFPTFLSRGLGSQACATPLFGVELNAGRGPDELKFFTGYAVQIGGIQTSADKSGSPSTCAATPPKQ